MLKKIPIQQVQLGMYLQSMEGSWLSHPFWKTKFVLREAADLEALLTSGVPAVWIDISKGADVQTAPAPDSLVQDLMDEPQPAPPPPASTPAPAPAAALARPERVSLGSEMGRAVQTINRSRQAVTALFGEARMGKAVDAEMCMPLVEEVAESVSRNPSALISLARLKTKDDYTYMHSVAVCALMVSLSRQLGLDDTQTREAGMAGLLHDIGKMMMPLDVLNKPGQLTEAEFDIMRSHPMRGYMMLKEGGAVPESALDVCLHHHEKMDGSGYPQGLKGEEISLLARMGAVCDVYDAITSTRPYKAAWDPAGSIQRMAQWTGQFDPVVFKAFVKSVGIYPVGSLVRLDSGRLAVVIDLNPQNLAAPHVRVFYSTKSKLPIPVQQLDLSNPAVGDRVVGRESPQDWGFTHLDDIWRKT
ncbi:HD-GYP domain-containing protein [Paucibacter sp. DJ2R-2]|uniref:HD-GYP domain-containing protein n=1 Tax=Paucibacter sp. DJ2R-2 TaxID=2893558 RepID=UPI0021E3E1D2|nr:HD-GYP domain-containing protein [Paucibacter sp. DJ2R-2]MCV2422738.1 HD-GYP domain-containing protein [Paucibacter sp. DJ4R-1]MCV2441121.1 HD-GYP domain-containing protein [Paucibacter sp. DJ2R-2]